jgi:3-hydroxy-9,10-secoandrosta-1,3,5(10)-triene-9,17-dione monooxygenase reductase component
MPIDKQEFRRVLGHFAAGVTIVTTVDANGAPYGLTATAFTSVSLDPPLVLVCVDKGSESHPHFHTSRLFAVNFLCTGHEHLSRHFAVSGGDKFQNVTYVRGVTGAPLLPEALGYLECRTVEVIEGGDHTIFLGEVEAGDTREGEPLLYYRGAYRRMGE